MEDYIQTLLDNLEENLPASLGGTYYTALNREISAAQALADTLSEEQQRRHNRPSFFPAGVYGFENR